MFARTSTWSGSPVALQKWAAHAATTVKGFVEGLPRNTGVVFLIDRDSGAALTLTLWDIQDAARATDRSADRRRDRHGTAPAEVAPVILSAYGLTDREQTICGLV
jgi:hypothetical protein